MEEETTLPYGREFELELLGITGEWSLNEKPDYLNFDSAMQKVAGTPLKKPNHNGGWYTPTEPNWGKLYPLWLEVHRHLPRRCEGARSGPLSLYISVGTSLDYHHGVDSFFWWMGVYVSIDASLVPKEKRGRGKEHLKADVLLTPDSLTPEGLVFLGEQVANLLKKKRCLLRKTNQRYRISRNDRELYE
jgi:hypothetical protein